MPERTIFRGVRLVDPAAGRDEHADVVVVDGVIESVDPAGKGSGTGEIVEGDGLVLAPGFVDLHCHLREPGWEDRETVETGSRAAAAGGFTAVAAMANTDPVADNAAVIQEVLTLAEKAGLCDVSPVGAITIGLAGEVLTEMGEMASLGVRMFSDDGHCVPRSRVLRMALEYARAFDVIIAEHCEDTSLSEGTHVHEGPTSEARRLGDTPPRPRRSSSRATSLWRASPEAACTCATSRPRGPLSWFAGPRARACG
ncbi:MAG: amidohydrolase family protein [Actinomycetota bacterium]